MDPFDELIGEHPKMVALRQRARTITSRHKGARRLPPILLEGETGSGKGLLARLLHRAGPRASAVFVEQNCAAIPESLLEAELFGYERGAFTDARQARPGLFLMAHGGTLFLDEVGLLPRGLQPKLLTVLEQGSVRRLGATKSEPADVSILAATNESLQTAVAEGRFRADLYHRLAVLTLELPPLRERPEDIELLAARLLARVCAEYKLPIRALSGDARNALKAHDWPGNVRELGNVIERAVLLSDAEMIAAAGLELPRRTTRPTRPGTPPPAATAEETTRQRLVEALEQTGWNITRTAALLGITRNTVRAWIRLHGLRAAHGADKTPTAPSPASQPADEATPPAASAAADHVKPAASSGIRWERRRLTFLRARLLPIPDATSAVTTSVFGWLIEKAHTFGGQVIEVSPQSIVAVFGHEPAEDAPRRAATAALAVAKLAARGDLQGDGGAEVSVALAIHVDRAALARIDGRSVIDQDAARHAAAALDELEPIAAGEIGVTEAAVEFLLRHFEVTRPPGGRPGSHRLVGRWGTPGRAHPVAFIGRRPEIEILRSLLGQAMQGHGKIVMLVGEPGIGKSRLVQEFQQSTLADGVLAREGRCAPYGTHVPYFPATEIVQAFCDVEDTDLVEAVDEKVLAALRPLGAAALESAPYLQYLLFPRKGGELSGRSPDAIKTGTFEAVRRLILAQQERRPLLLVVEDLQWIDQTSEELLATVAEMTTDARLLLVTTARPGYQAPWSARPNVTQIAVGPLSNPDSRRLVELVLAERPVPDTVVTRVLARGEGNPFFLEELARSIRERPDDPSRVTVPGTVHDALAIRVDALGDADKHLLDVAAVIGREVPLWLLQEASDLSADDVQAGLIRLLAGEFLHAAGFGAEAEFVFKHALTHEVAYASVSDTSRVRLNERVAAAITKLAPELRERRPAMLARHYTEAGQPAEAIDHWCRAGQLAMQRSAHGDAIVHFERALELLDAQPESAARDAQEIPAQLALATSLTAARGYGAPDVERTLSHIRVVAGRLTDPAQKFSVQWTLWRFQFSRADFRAAEELVASILALAEGLADPVVQVGAHVAAGVDLFYLGQFERAREHLAQAIASYDRAQTAAHLPRYGQDLGVAAWGFLGWADAVVGDVDTAVWRAETAVQLARDNGHPFSLALALFLACEIHELRRDFTTVQRLGDELVALAREYGFAFFVALGLTHAGWARSTGHDVSGGVAMMQEGAALFRAVGQRVGLAHRGRLAEGLLATGGVDAVLDVVTEALEQRRETEEHAFAAPLLVLRGEALARQGETAGAAQAFREAIELATRQGASLFARDATSALHRLENPR